MKHTLPGILLLLFATLTATAQLRPYVRVGAGASGADLSGRMLIEREHNVFYEGVVSEADKAKSIVSGGVGFGVQADLGHRFGIQVEVNLEQRGFRTNVETYYSGCNRCTVYYPPKEKPATGSIETRLTYLTLPVLASYRFGKWAVLAGQIGRAHV